MVYLTDEAKYLFHDKRYCGELEMRAAYVKLEAVETEGCFFSYLLFFFFLIKAVPNRLNSCLYEDKLKMKNKGNFGLAVGNRVRN